MGTFTDDQPLPNAALLLGLVVVFLILSFVTHLQQYYACLLYTSIPSAIIFQHTAGRVCFRAGGDRNETTSLLGLGRRDLHGHGDDYGLQTQISIERKERFP